MGRRVPQQLRHSRQETTQLAKKSFTFLQDVIRHFNSSVTKTTFSFIMSLNRMMTSSTRTRRRRYTNRRLRRSSHNRAFRHFTYGVTRRHLATRRGNNSRRRGTRRSSRMRQNQHRKHRTKGNMTSRTRNEPTTLPNDTKLSIRLRPHHTRTRPHQRNTMRNIPLQRVRRSRRNLTIRRLRIKTTTRINLNHLTSRPVRPTNNNTINNTFNTTLTLSTLRSLSTLNPRLMRFKSHFRKILRIAIRYSTTITTNNLRPNMRNYFLTRDTKRTSTTRLQMYLHHLTSSIPTIINKTVISRRRLVTSINNNRSLNRPPNRFKSILHLIINKRSSKRGQFDNRNTQPPFN